MNPEFHLDDESELDDELELDAVAFSNRLAAVCMLMACVDLCMYK